jgi:hypothetical protein
MPWASRRMRLARHSDASNLDQSQLVHSQYFDVLRCHGIVAIGEVRSPDKHEPKEINHEFGDFEFMFRSLATWRRHRDAVSRAKEQPSLPARPSRRAALPTAGQAASGRNLLP